MRSSLFTVFFVVLVATSAANALSTNEAPSKFLGQRISSSHLNSELSQTSGHSGAIKLLAKSIKSLSQAGFKKVFGAGPELTVQESKLFGISVKDRAEWNDGREKAIATHTVSKYGMFKKLAEWRLAIIAWRKCAGHEQPATAYPSRKEIEGGVKNGRCTNFLRVN